MPFVAREPNSSTLISVDRARGEMPVLLVSTTEHHKVAGWCNWYRCIETAPLPQGFPRGNKDAWDALFALTAFLKTNRNWLIWLQDNVQVLDLYDIPDHDIACLRVGTEHCGMVAYKMKRWVVEHFVRRIERNMHNTPIDWILDDMRQDLGLTLHRVPKVKTTTSHGQYLRT